MERIKGEIYLSDDISDAFPNKYPHKSEATVTCICIKGEITAEINQFPVCAKAPGLLVLLPGQIRELTNVSDDFQGEFIIMTRQFTESISLPEGFPHSCPSVAHLFYLWGKEHWRPSLIIIKC